MDNKERESVRDEKQKRWFLLEEKRENFNIAAVRISEMLVTTKVKMRSIDKKGNRNTYDISFIKHVTSY